MLVLPLLALALIGIFHLEVTAVGLILLAATPGSTTAYLYSHIFGGHVGFNIALTGLNTLLCALTLPFLGSWAMAHYVGGGQTLPILVDRAAQTITIVIAPVLVGMLISAKAPRIAGAVDRPVEVLSAFLVVVFSLLGILKERDALIDGFVQVGSAILLFNALCLGLGFWVARLLSLEK